MSARMDLISLRKRVGCHGDNKLILGPQGATEVQIRSNETVFLVMQSLLHVFGLELKLPKLSLVVV